MGIFDDIKKMSANDVAFAVTGFLSAVAPGFLTLYLFKPSLIVSLDNFKLILFALALTLPVIAANFFAIAAAHPFLTKGAQSQIPTDTDRAQALISAMSLSIFVLYPSIALVFWLGLSFRIFLVTVAAWQLVVLLFLYAEFRVVRKRRPYLADPFGIGRPNDELACSRCGASLSLSDADADRDGRPVATCPRCGHKNTVIVTAGSRMGSEKIS